MLYENNGSLLNPQQQFYLKKPINVKQLLFIYLFIYVLNVILTFTVVFYLMY